MVSKTGDSKAEVGESLGEHFSTKLSFNPLYPYENLFRERIPMVQALQIAIANYIANRANRRDMKDGRALAIQHRASETRFLAAECGVYMGAGLISAATILRDAGLSYLLYGLDTFNGLPELGAQDRRLAPENAPYLKTKWFADTSLEEVQRRVSAAKFESCVKLIQGRFAETISTLPVHRYHFINLDCDIYEPHLECLRYFYPRVEPGGVIFFDDYYSVEYPMARVAIDEFMRDKPEKLFHLRFGEDGPNVTKAFILKY